MTRFVALRLVALIPILLGVALLTFLLVHIMPGDPLDNVLGPQATAEQRDVFAHAMGMDKGLPEQFGLWLAHVTQGDLGRSIAFNAPVTKLLLPALKNTATLAAAAAVVGLVLGSVVGTVAAAHRGGLVDKALSSVSMIGLSVPHYWLGMVLVIVLGVELRLLPVSGTGDGTLPDLLRHLVLPTCAVALPVVGLVARMVRAHVVEELGSDHVQFLRANGMSRTRSYRQVWRNVLPGVLTIFGLELGNLLGGSALVEIVFSWPGVGKLVYDAVSQRDIPMIQAALLLVGLVYVLVNLLVDVGQTVLDPRARRQAVSA